MIQLFLSIVIPAYNEAQRIGRTLEKIRAFVESRRYAAELIAVEDGSSDTTGEILCRAAAAWPAVRVLSNGVNRGKGLSVRRGVLAARGEYVLLTDADLSTPIEELDRLFPALDKAHAAAAVGSRALRRDWVGKRQSWFREFAGRGFNRMVRLSTSLPIHDTQCGFKLYRRSAVLRAFEIQRSTGFGFDAEVLFHIVRLGGRVVEVPVRWDNDPATKVRLLRDPALMLLDLIRLRWRVWTGAYDAAPSVTAPTPHTGSRRSEAGSHGQSLS